MAFAPMLGVPQTIDTSVGSDTDDRRKRLRLESLDGTVVIDLCSEPYKVLGVVGFEDPPVSFDVESSADMHGDEVEGVLVDARPLTIVYRIKSSDPKVVDAAHRAVRSLTNPVGFSGAAKGFLVVASSDLGERVSVAYRDKGTEGDSTDDTWQYRKRSLAITCHDPFPTLREDVVLGPYDLADYEEPFLSDDDDDDWPRALSGSIIDGTNIAIIVKGDVETWSTVKLDGTADSALITTADGYSLDMPHTQGTTDSMVVTAKPVSARFNDAPAGSRITLDSQLLPFNPGQQALTYAVPGADETTKLTMSWPVRFLAFW